MSSDRLLPFSEQAPKLLGNSLCLDLVNTVDWRGRAGDSDGLTDYGQLVHWGLHAGAFNKAESVRLLSEARRHPAAAQRVLETAVALREAIARIFSHSAPRKRGNLALLNELLTRAPARSAVVAGKDGYRWEHEGETALLEQPLWPVLWDAADLLTSDRREWVRRCGDPECGWMFLDLSRTGTRRWCSMEGCGNRAKARRHYSKHRSGDRRKVAVERDPRSKRSYIGAL